MTLRLPVRVNDKAGYIDEKGAIVIPLEYDGAGPFSEGVAEAWKRDENALYVIDTKGVMQGKAEKVVTYSSFSDGLLQFRVHDKEFGHLGKAGYLDRHASVAIPPIFDSARAFQDGLACVEIDSKYGVIDQQ